MLLRQLTRCSEATQTDCRSRGREGRLRRSQFRWAASVSGERSSVNARFAEGDRRLRPRCRSTSLPYAASPTLRIKFSVPYRCHFGQHLRVVGNVDTLGAWQLHQALKMEWSPGDVWTAEAEVFVGNGAEVEYKYVVCDDDGTSHAWKPGGNFAINVPETGTGSVKVKDAWDEAFREVQIETIRDVSSKRRRRKPGDRGNENDAAGEGGSLVALASGALEQLETAVETCMRLMENGSDPASAELLAADRMVAAAQQRAVAMAQALDVASAKPINET